MEKVFRGLWIIIGGLAIVVVFLLLSTLARAETLSWDPNPDAATYSVFVREKGQTAYTPVVTGVTGTTVTVTPAANNRTYEYTVKAFNECGISSVFSDPVEYNKCLSSTVQKVGNVRITITVNVEPVR